MDLNKENFTMKSSKAKHRTFDEYLKRLAIKWLLNLGILFLLALVAYFIIWGPKEYRTLESFKKDQIQIAYDRSSEPYTTVVDTHVHFRPFGGEEIPFEEVLGYFRRTSVRFVNIYGIGQRVPIDSDCIYYLDCLGTPVLPTIKNDFLNAETFIKNKPNDLHLTLSMTFPDLANPEEILQQMNLLSKEYPGVFSWMGEVNLVKQALLQNHHEPASIEDIPNWKEFMTGLRERDIPINIHSDLGNDKDPTKYLHLMESVLEQYPDNKIVWAHMGLSKELANMDPNQHIQLMERLLDKHPNLTLDITWRVIEDNYFSKYRDEYVAFLNKYHDRILPGTDFVASQTKSFKIYKEELEVNSEILKHLSDEAFRSIALGNNYFKLLDLDYVAPQILQE